MAHLIHELKKTLTVPLLPFGVAGQPASLKSHSGGGEGKKCAASSHVIPFKDGDVVGGLPPPPKSKQVIKESEVPLAVQFFAAELAGIGDNRVPAVLVSLDLRPGMRPLEAMLTIVRSVAVGSRSSNLASIVVHVHPFQRCRVRPDWPAPFDTCIIPKLCAMSSAAPVRYRLCLVIWRVQLATCVS